MAVVSQPFPSNLLIFPTTNYTVGSLEKGDSIVDVVRTFTVSDIATIHVTKILGLGFEFSTDGPLRSFPKLDTVESGEVPEEVIENHDLIISLQSRRILFCNFIASVFFGHLSALGKWSIHGASHARLDTVLSFIRFKNRLIVEGTNIAKSIIGDLMHDLNSNNPFSIKEEHIDNAISFALAIAPLKDKFELVDLEVCLALNYQAAILHTLQISSASYALNFSVAESLIRELFFAYGIARNSTQKFFHKKHINFQISKGQFDKLKLKEMLELLKDGNIIDDFLYKRLDEARLLRNKLMHDGAAVTLRHSGTLQTAVRDLWAYYFELPFSLVSSWTMRT